nr:TMEM175 family protein [Rhizomicrobium palustre]
MLFFSDAVFAIALTLLVLDLRPPEHLEASIADTLGGMASAFVSFINSFCLAGLWWFIHMRVTKLIQIFDWPVAICNFLFLLTVTLMPFAAALLSHGVNTGLVWAIYWSVNLGSSATLTLLVLMATRSGGKLVGGTTAARRYFNAARTFSPSLCFAAGIFFGLKAEVGLAQWAWVPIPFLLIIMARLQRRFA